MDFLKAIEVGRVTGAAMPRDILIYGIEVADPGSLGEEVSRVLREKVGDIAREIARDLDGEVE
jgi:hypothetical protein